MSYTALEYIESTGTQYIDTGIFASPRYSLEVSFMVSQLTTNWDTIFGARNASYSRYTARFGNAVDGLLGLQYSNRGSGQVAYYDSAYIKTDFSHNFHLIKVEKNCWYVDGMLDKVFDSPADSVQYPYSLYLFANNNAGTPGDYAYIRIAYCKIWDEDDLVRDFVPVLDENGAACLFDKVTSSYFYDGNKKLFTAGPMVADYASEGAAIFIFDDLSRITSAKESVIRWTEHVPDGCSLNVFARVNDGEFLECDNGSSIPCISVGDDLSSKSLEIKVVMSTEDASKTPTLTDMMITICNSGDDHVLVLEFASGNTNSLQNAVGDIDISYGGGTLHGIGGAVAPFDISFTPDGYIAKNHPHDVEHIEIVNLSANAKLTKVRYVNVKSEEEHIVINDISAQGKLTSVDDI